MASRITTGFGLSAKQVLRGLLDYGLFSEKAPLCFSSAELTDKIPKRLWSIISETVENRLQRRIRAPHDFIRYESLRDVNVPRQIGIPHPESYIVQCLAVARHWTTIKQHCAKPHWPATRTYVQKTSSDRVFLMNYKGPHRFEHEETDIRHMMGARYAVRADISNCFPSIYTHSIPWAIHGRNAAKGNRSILLAGNLLDTVTQNTRDRQTNGLLIGPHASSVLSEVILTSVDASLLKKGFHAVRHIDDYVHYAATHSDAEDFIRELAVQLREYELALNERKTKIVAMPIPLHDDWIRELQLMRLPDTSAIRFSEVRSLMDSALRIAEREKNSRVLNYAIKMVPDRLNSRAKRLFMQHVVNLAILYPYLAPLLDEHVFEKHGYQGMRTVVHQFVAELLSIGIKRLFPDAIAHSLYYAIKYDIALNLGPIEDSIIAIDDCLTLVLLLEYARRRGMSNLAQKISTRANGLKGGESRDKDRYWLLIYQIWSVQELNTEKQSFLSDLKRSRMVFLRFP